MGRGRQGERFLWACEGRLIIVGEEMGGVAGVGFGVRVGWGQHGTRTKGQRTMGWGVIKKGVLTPNDMWKRGEFFYWVRERQCSRRGYLVLPRILFPGTAIVLDVRR